MTVYVGREGSLGIGLQASIGTTTEIDKFIPFTECSLGEVHEPIADNSAKGVRDSQSSNSVVGKKRAEGTVTVVLNAKHAPYFFGLALGSVDSTDSITPLYRHTITRKTGSEPLSATIWRDRSVDKVTFKDACVNKLDLNFSDDVAELKAEVMSKYPVAGTAETPSMETIELYTFKNAYVELTSPVGGSTSELKIRELSLSINNNIEAVYAPNSNDVDRFISKNFDVSGSMTVLFEDETQKDAWTDLTKQGVSIVFEGSTTGKITIAIPQFRVQSGTIDTPIDDVNSQTIEFIGEYDGTKTIDVTIDNDVASY